MESTHFRSGGHILRFHAALFRELGARHVAIRHVHDEQQHTRRVEAALKSDVVYLEFSDGYRRVRLSEAERRDREKRESYAPSYDYPPSGVGTFRVMWADPHRTLEWKGTRTRLEEMLPEIVEKILAAFTEQPIAREERRLAEEAALRAQRLREKREAIVRSRKEQVSIAKELSDELRAHRATSAYVDELEQWVSQLAPPYDERAGAWIKVVRAELASFDPLQEFGQRCLVGHGWRGWPPPWYESEDSSEEGTE